jgi:hypothetical protein
MKLGIAHLSNRCCCAVLFVVVINTKQNVPTSEVGGRLSSFNIGL